MTVSDLCFCHWPVAADALGRSVPDWLTVDTADGNAWLTAIPATVTGITAFGINLARPVEAVTVQTPVRGPDGQRGLYCFAVVVDTPIAAAATTPLSQLPIRRGQHTRGSTDSQGKTRRTVQTDGQRLLTVTYRTAAREPTPAPPDSLASFLAERRRYFAPGPLGSRLCSSVGRDPLALAPVDADVSTAVSSTLGLPDPVGKPLCQYSPGAELSVDRPRPTRFG